MRDAILYTLTILLIMACKPTTNVIQSQSAQGFISFENSNIQYEGRIEKSDAAYLYWSGSAARIRFNGSGLSAVLQDFNGQNYFSVIIDGDVSKKIRIDSAKKLYKLVEGLAPGEHVVELFKGTQINKEYNRGFTKFFGFQLDGKATLLSAPKVKKRKIEFYGNSITCGHAIEDSAGNDSGASVFENNYLSYAALTARHFNAQYHCIAESGIGLIAGFRKEIMPEIYDLLNPFDSLSRWSFKKYTPDIVVVNLLQNDEAVLGQPQSEAYKRRLGNRRLTNDEIISAYQSFIQKIRDHYPNANIICVLGNMSITKAGSVWPGYVKQAVAGLHDKKIFYHFFEYKGTPKHPLIKDHEAMAASLINFIGKNIRW